MICCLCFEELLVPSLHMSGKYFEDVCPSCEEQERNYGAQLQLTLGEIQNENWSFS